MDWSVLYPGKYVKAEDLMGKHITKTIKDVKLEEIEGIDGTKKQKVVIRFTDSPKMWICPITCGLALRAMFGRETQAWLGKRVTLFPKKVDSFGEEVEAVRVAGSPDIKAPIKESIKRGKKTIVIDLRPTKEPAAPAEAEPGSAG